jgi:ATP-dependent RNA helicase RhlE
VTTFQDLGLDPLLLKALDTEGYTTPTPIQAQAIPSILAGKDLLGIAQTGTGKTAAFALPILQRLAANRQPALRKGIRTLILSPTRELATQIGESFRTYGRHMGFSVAVVFGGVAHKPQRDALARGVDVLVATPGRLLDHMTERNVTLEGTEILVLDEADQMMDLGFIRPLRQIVSKLSHRRQSLFFSATMPHEIGALAAELLKDPVKVSVTPVAKTADRVAQEVIFIEQQKKRSLLVELFANPDMTRTIVFTRTKRGADRVARHLETAGVPVAAIHGNKSQAQRDAAMRGFKAGKIRALIATDIAARGIDIDAVSHVVNYEIPNVPESYVHRIGRTARAGAEGIAISLVDNEERGYLRDIERLTRLQIPSKDRRNDASLVAPVETRAERDAERADRADHRGGGRGHAGGGRGFGGGGSRPQRDRSDDRGGRGFGSGGARNGSSGAGRHSNAGEAPVSNHRDARPFTSGEGRPERGEARGHTNGGAGRGPDRREAHRDNRDRPQRAHGGGRGGDDRRGERGGEGRPARPYEDRRGEGRPAHRRDEGRTASEGPRHERGAHDRKGSSEHRSSEHRSTEHRATEHKPHDRHARTGEGRHRHPGDHHRAGDRPDRAEGRHGERGQRSGGAGPGLEGVKFLSNRGDRPRSRPSAPRGDDRRKAPTRTA